MLTYRLNPGQTMKLRSGVELTAPTIRDRTVLNFRVGTDRITMERDPGRASRVLVKVTDAEVSQ